VSTLNPFNSSLPTKPLKHLVALRGDKVDSVPADGEYIGLEQMESGTGRLSEVELQQQPEGSANVFQPGDVLFGKLRPYLAKGWTADRPGYCTTEALVLQPKGADPRFVRYCVLAAEFIEAVNGSTYGSKMPRADWSFVGAVQVPCPTQSVQERIANFLDEQTARIDALIAEKERLDSLLSEYRQSLISEAVTGRVNVDAPNAESRSGGADEGGAGVTSLSSLKYITRLEYGDALAQEVRDDGDVPVFGSNGIVGTHSAANTEAPAIIIGRKGSFGKVTWTDIPGFCIDTAYYIDRRHTGCNLRWLYWTLQTLGLDAHSEDTGVPGLSREKAYQSKLRKPSVSEQQRIANFLDEQTARIDALKAHVKEHIALLREYRSSLISAAVTGQLDISTFKAAV
jgi:type I restriction enzyme S subunit